MIHFFRRSLSVCLCVCKSSMKNIYFNLEINAERRLILFSTLIIAKNALYSAQ